MKNKLTDLNNHLFAQLERLSDESIKGEELNQEMDRAKAVAGVAKEIIANGKLVLEVQREFGGLRTEVPDMMKIADQSNAGSSKQ